MPNHQDFYKNWETVEGLLIGELTSFDLSMVNDLIEVSTMYYRS